MEVVHLFENHSSALPAWRRAEVRDRILVHVDGHSDFDWLPDETVARFAAARADELSDFEVHPYALDDRTHRGFGIWNFIYPAARMGIVREVVWVVPDGSLRDRDAAADLVRELIVGKIQMIAPEEATAIRFEERKLLGTLLGVPVTVCELRDLPEIAEPVLLDVDLDFTTTALASTQEVTARPWISPRRLVDALASKGLRADIATLSLSTIGGYLPPANRWVGPALQHALRVPGRPPNPADEERAGAGAGQAGDVSAAATVERYRNLAARDPEDPSAWYVLSVALASAGRSGEAAEARAKADALDPLFRHAELFEADRAWINGDFDAALRRYGSYRKSAPESPFDTYALRREATCLVRLGRSEEALAAYRRVVAAAPRHGDSRLDLGVLLRERGDLEGAIRELRTAREILPDLATYAMALGNTLLRMGRAEEGVQELEAAVARKPCWTAAQINLAIALAGLGRWDDAASHVDTALVLDPRSPQLAELRARLSRRGARPEAAAAHP